MKRVQFARQGIVVFASQTAETRIETLGGVVYLVAPSVAIRPGVLNGEWVPAEEIAHFSQAWDGRPVMLGHPVDEMGFNISANDPALLAERGIGYLFYTAYQPDGRLLTELWLPVEQNQARGGQAAEALERLQAGEALDVSTAYWRDVEPGSGTVHGVSYNGIARNLRPDHLALLLDGRGACSWADGCGVPRTNESEGSSMKFNVLAKARTPAYSGTETTAWGDVSKTFQAYRDGYYKHTGAEKPEDVPGSVGAAPAEMKRWIASKSLLGDPAADSFRDLLFFPVVNPGSDKLNAGALRAVLGGRGSEADIPEEAKESAQAKARSLLEKEFEVETEAAQNEDRSLLRLALQALAGVFGQRKVKAPGLGALEESLDEQARQVRQAWEQAFADPDGYALGWPREVFEEYVIVETEQGLVSYPWTEDENGQIVFGDPVRVEVQYVPVGQSPPEEVDSMKDLIQRIIDSGAVAMNAEELEAAPEPLLRALDTILAAASTEPASGRVEPNSPQLAPAANAEPEPDPDALPEALQVLAAKLEGVDPDRFLGAVDRILEGDDARRTWLVQALAGNVSCTFDQAHLERLDTSTLEALHASLTPADFSGQGGGPEPVPAGAEIEPYTMPDVFRPNGDGA